MWRVAEFTVLKKKKRSGYATGRNMLQQEVQKSGVILKGGRILGVKLVREMRFCRDGS